MDTLLIIGVFALGAIISVVFYFLNKGKNTSGASLKLQEAYANPQMAKMALWIELDSVNGEYFDWDMSYYTKVKSNMTGSYTDVLVALIEPGNYTFVVTSRRFKKVSMEVSVEAGVTYQLGADQDGPYFIEDSEPARYAMK